MRGRGRRLSRKCARGRPARAAFCRHFSRRGSLSQAVREAGTLQGPDGFAEPVERLPVLFPVLVPEFPFGKHLLLRRRDRVIRRPDRTGGTCDVDESDDHANRNFDRTGKVDRVEVTRGGQDFRVPLGLRDQARPAGRTGAREGCRGAFRECGKGVAELSGSAGLNTPT